MDEDGYYGDEERVSPWQQLNSRDFGLLGFTAVHHLIVLCVVVHLACKRDWPPYVTKNVTLVRSYVCWTVVCVVYSLGSAR